MLGDPGVGIGGHPGQVDAASGHIDREQDVEPPQPDGVDGEAGRRRGSRRPVDAGTPVKWWPLAAASGPDRGGAAWCGSRWPRRGSQAGAVRP
jgi:hypothetical protein